MSDRLTLGQPQPSPKVTARETVSVGRADFAADHSMRVAVGRSVNPTRLANGLRLCLEPPLLDPAYAAWAEWGPETVLCG